MRLHFKQTDIYIIAHHVCQNQSQIEIREAVANDLNETEAIEEFPFKFESPFRKKQRKQRSNSSE